MFVLASSSFSRIVCVLIRGGLSLAADVFDVDVELLLVFRLSHRTRIGRSFKLSVCAFWLIPVAVFELPCYLLLSRVPKKLQSSTSFL